MSLNSATQVLTNAQVYQDLVRTGTHVDLDGVAMFRVFPVLLPTTPVWYDLSKG